MVGGIVDDGVKECDEEMGVLVGLVNEREVGGVDVRWEVFVEVFNVVVKNSGSYGFCGVGGR